MLLVLRVYTFLPIALEPGTLAEWNNYHWNQLLKPVRMSCRSCDSDHRITRSDDICVRILLIIRIDMWLRSYWPEILRPKSKGSKGSKESYISKITFISIISIISIISFISFIYNISISFALLLVLFLSFKLNLYFFIVIIYTCNFSINTLPFCPPAKAVSSYTGK